MTRAVWTGGCCLVWMVFTACGDEVVRLQIEAPAPRDAHREDDDRCCVYGMPYIVEFVCMLVVCKRMTRDNKFVASRAICWPVARWSGRMWYT